MFVFLRGSYQYFACRELFRIYTDGIRTDVCQHGFRDCNYPINFEQVIKGISFVLTA